MDYSITFTSIEDQHHNDPLMCTLQQNDFIHFNELYMPYTIFRSSYLFPSQSIHQATIFFQGYLRNMYGMPLEWPLLLTKGAIRV